MDVNEIFELVFANSLAGATVVIGIACVGMLVFSLFERDWRAARVFAALAVLFLAIFGWSQPNEEIKVPALGIVFLAIGCLVWMLAHGIYEERTGVRAREDERTTRG